VTSRSSSPRKDGGRSDHGTSSKHKLSKEERATKRTERRQARSQALAELRAAAYRAPNPFVPLARSEAQRAARKRLVPRLRVHDVSAEASKLLGAPPPAPVPKPAGSKHQVAEGSATATDKDIPITVTDDQPGADPSSAVDMPMLDAGTLMEDHTARTTARIDKSPARLARSSAFQQPAKALALATQLYGPQTRNSNRPKHSRVHPKAEGSRPIGRHGSRSPRAPAGAASPRQSPLQTNPPPATSPSDRSAQEADAEYGDDFVA
jgi:hypothetical protein